MRKLIFTALILALIQVVSAQINAVTETGDEVVLFNDGTWKYLNNINLEESGIPTSAIQYEKDKRSTFLVKSSKLNIGVWINPKVWSFSKGEENEAYEFQFQKKGDDLYGMLIAEKVQIPIENLRAIAIENAKKAAPDIKVLKEEFRVVNGVEVLMMNMSGTIQGIKFSYYGYYYSNSNGTIQFLTYTGENLFNNYLKEIELLINGFVEL